MEVHGQIPRIIRNKEDLYEGDLIIYFKKVFENARNLRCPYHNFRHMLHVLFLCHSACIFYKDILTSREKRNLLIAALFHDFDHSGTMGDDDLNIEKATRGLKKHLLPEDEKFFGEITELIEATEFPYKRQTADLSLSGQIIRDADMCQCFSVAWIQQVIFGLASEWNKTPIEVLKMQPPFIRNLKFHTKWAKGLFTTEQVEEKIKETNELLELLGA